MEIKKLIEKFLEDKCSKDELELLGRYLNSGETSEFDQEFYEKWNRQQDQFINDSKAEFLWRGIKASVIESRKSSFQRYSVVFKYAAVLLAFAATGYFILSKLNRTEELDDAITITYQDGETKKIIVGDSTNLFDKEGKILARQTKGRVDFSENQNEDVLEFSTVKVPLGKKLEVVLPDQSLIYLNGGTELRFPNSFKGMDNRTIYLSGEAYFSVFKDRNKPFIVSAGDLKTKVFGTVFNVDAFQSSSKIEVVLVEGSVGLFVEDESSPLMIKPNQLASYVLNQDITVTDVNIEDHVAWVDGVLLFRDESFSEIQRKLERHFGLTIKNYNKTIENRRFSGRFEKESLEEVLQVIQDVAPFTYEYKNQTLTIK
ncbi:DUF4974 domain-containing protein [Zhouia spongiae]|uniref:DUF4974 domain-containing protein n=1 Tax=Zhouia spongiae TaxID=2202721 RepID=A0ABY3YLC5_9FLAO|nr:FecR domain-containing protein [Zhouia spongiae]UNY98639.1 DUF4974 domain-containing protein [Zhouia spongiae]